MTFLNQIEYSDILDNKDLFLERLRTNKVLVIRNYKQDLSISKFIDSFVSEFGSIISSEENLKTGEATGEKMMEISFDPKDQNQYRTSKANQPLHTDYSYIDTNNTIQFLMCLKKAPLAGATTFIDTRTLVELLLIDDEISLYKNLLTVPINFSKGDRNKTSVILKKANEDFQINWNYPPAKRGNNSSQALDLIEKFKCWLENRVEKSGLLHNILLEDNDVVFFHDYKVLHGRNCYFAKNKGERSLLKGTLIL